LKVTTIFHQNIHGEPFRIDEHLDYLMQRKGVLKKHSVKEKKAIPAIYDEEVFAASSEPPTSDPFMTMKSGENFLLWQKSKHTGILGRLYHYTTGRRRTKGMDNRFKTIAQYCQRRLTIHAYVACNLMSAIYSLCMNKDVGIYLAMFSQIYFE
ncbi:hypothetical protein T4E_5952, partial [Trichinella pseudospiralis]